MFAVAAGLVLSASNAGAEERVHRVGVLLDWPQADTIKAWLEGLRERGYVDRKNLNIEYRYYQGRSEQISVVAAELLALDPEVIVTLGPAAAAVRAAVPPTIPLVFVGQRDPVALRLVESLAHPGGNATGTATIVPEGFIGKQLQLLKDPVPQLGSPCCVIPKIQCLRECSQSYSRSDDSWA
jgi:putative ABC transport system substrate-binding protein